MGEETIDVQAVAKALQLRQLILGAQPKLVPVECPEWGCTVYVDGSLTLADRLEFASLAKSGRDITIETVILGARDEAGVKLFSPGDHDALANLDGGVLQRIALAVLRANGWTEDDAEAVRKN